MQTLLSIQSHGSKCWTVHCASCLGFCSRPWSSMLNSLHKQLCCNNSHSVGIMPPTKLETRYICQVIYSQLWWNKTLCGLQHSIFLKHISRYYPSCTCHWETWTLTRTIQLTCLLEPNGACSCSQYFLNNNCIKFIILRVTYHSVFSDGFKLKQL